MLPFRRVLATLFVAALLTAGCTADSAGSAAADSTALDSTAAPPSTAGDLPPSRAQGAAPAPDYEQALSNLLAKIVTADGHVRYDLLREQEIEPFRRVLKAVEDYDATALDSQEEKLAFWINAYNVQMLANVLESWPVRDVSSRSEQFFETPLRTAGTALSLDQIENVILRRQDGPQRAEQFRVAKLDPRLHAAVNCAARSCPPLRQQAFTPQTVDAMLDEAMRDFTASPDHLQRVPGGGFAFNSILKWYGADFDRRDRPAGDYLLSFMPESRPDYDALRRVLEGRSAEQLQQQENVSFQYDWTLNATPASLPGSSSS